MAERARGRGDGVEVDADIVYARRLCRSVVDFVADDAEDDYSVATRWYRAPELLKRLQTRRGTAVDLWAVGCVIGEMYLGRPIFPGKDTQEQLQLVEEPSFEYLQEEPACRAKSLVAKLLRHDPARRPTARRALDDAWLNQFKGTEEEPSYKNGPVRLPVGDDARLACEYRNGLHGRGAREESKFQSPGSRPVSLDRRWISKDPVLAAA